MPKRDGVINQQTYKFNKVQIPINQYKIGIEYSSQQVSQMSVPNGATRCQEKLFPFS